MLKEGYKSFPSGHSSWSFAGLGFLAWYIAGKIKVFDQRGHVAKLCLALLPLLVASLIAISRVDDYWHHWQDVFAGRFLGIYVFISWMLLADHDQISSAGVFLMESRQVFDIANQGDVLCDGDPAEIKEGYKIFPSGHSSWSFAGLGFLACYIAEKIKVFDQRGHVAKLCLALLPLLVASLIAISRVDDYWHHWQDVFAGGFLGLIVASFTYLQFFPLPSGEQDIQLL